MASENTKAFGDSIDSYVTEVARGVFRVEFSVDGKPVPTIELTGRMPELVAGFSQIKADLKDALEWLKRAEELLSAGEDGRAWGLMLDTDNSRQARGLFVGAVAFYGKCFAEAKGRRARLQKSDVDEKFHPAHEALMRYRNAYACHSGEEKFESGRTFIVLKPRDQPPSSVVIRVEGSRPNLVLATDEGQLFEDVIQHVYEVAVAKWQTLGDAMLNNHVYPKGADFCYGVAATGGVWNLE